MQYIDKFWTAFRDKLASFQPDAYTDNDWQEMELLLNGSAATPIKKPFLSFWKSKKAWVLLFLLFASMAGAYSLWINQYNKEDQNALTKESNEKSISSDHSITQLEKTAKTTSLTSTEEEANNHNRTQYIEITTRQEASNESLNSKADHISATKYAASQRPSLPAANLAMDNNSTNSATVDGGINTEIAYVDDMALIEQKEESLMADLDASTVFLPIVGMNELAVSPYLINDTIRLDTNIRRKWKKGISLGFNLATTNYNSIESSLIGYNVGALYQRALNERWSIELMPTFRLARVNEEDYTFAASDTSISIHGNILMIDIERRLGSYIALELPVLLSYHLNERWSLQGGVRGSLLLPWDTYGSGNANFSGSGAEDIMSFELTSMLLPVDAGVILGVRYEISTRYALALRYSQGIMDITPDNLYLNTATNTNSDLQISIYQKF